VSEEAHQADDLLGERDGSPAGRWPTSCLRSASATVVSEAIVFRAAEGFGPLRHVHTDRLLSLSEDLPVVATALARREDVDALLGEVLLRPAARASSRSSAPASLRPGTSAIDAGDADGDARKLTVHVGRGERVGGRRRSSPSASCCASGASAARACCSAVDGLRDGRRGARSTALAQRRCPDLDRRRRRA